MARSGSRTLLKSLGLTSLVTVTGGSAFLLSIKPKEDKHNTTSTSTLRRTAKGEVIPPSFPQTKLRVQQIADLRRTSQQTSTPTSQDSEIYDLVIIGGGATGSGIALDAVTRGLRVAVIERDDFSSGTSSKSTKLVHGGVRYLEKAVWNLDYGQYSLVKEALRERRAFLNNAPHLASSLPILLPIQKLWQAPYFWAGTKCYDLLAGGQGLESSYWVGRKSALEMFPMLDTTKLVGGLVYYDGQQNDSRMNVGLALTAELFGATTVNHMEVTALEKDSQGKICGARVKDLMSPEDDQSSPAEFTIRARGIINAAGPFVDAIEHMDDPKRKDLVAPSEGVHVVLPRHFGPLNNMGLLDASTSDGRVMFLLPWEGNLVAGTTDSACTVSNSLSAKESDISFILQEVSKYLSPSVNLQRSDVLAAWSGIRPLMRDPNSSNTESLVRNHLITVSPSGLLTCAGGKWTTYRQMAEDAVDAAIDAFSLQARPLSPAQIPNISGMNSPSTLPKFDGTCVTQHLQIVGAHGYHPLLHIDLLRAFPDRLTPEVAMHLVRSYGDRAWTLAAQYNTSETLSSKYPFTKGEVEYAIKNEYAMTAIDFLARRTRLTFLDVEEALKVLPAVVKQMGDEMQWSEERVAQEWKDSMWYLRSMGLEERKWEYTMQEVVEQQKQGAKKMLVGRASPTGKKHVQHEPLVVSGVDVDMPVAASAASSA